MKECSRCKEVRPLEGFYNKLKRNGTLGKSARCKICEKQLKAARYDPMKKRAADLRKTFGISLDEYDKMLEKQNGVCAICRGPHKGRGSFFHVDHCHSNGTVRGLLCSHCNVGLGYFSDNISNLENAILYLRNQ